MENAGLNTKPLLYALFFMIHFIKFQILIKLIRTSISNSGNVTFKVRVYFLITPELVHNVLKTVTFLLRSYLL